MREPKTPLGLTNLFVRLKAKRYRLKRKAGRRPRISLTPAERRQVRRKTDGRCHVCGGFVRGEWHADHVLAHSTGGLGRAGNYLAAHPLCNNYRWDYLSEEFQYILKLGVWAKSQIELEKGLGMEIADRFLRYEESRRRRRKKVR
jgi:hypothetical protein